MALTRRQRARTLRGTQYAVLVAAFVVIALIADWDTIFDRLLNPAVAAEQFPGIILTALRNTVIYTSLGFALALAVGLLLALMKLSSVAPYRWIANIYVEFFRGIPALLVFLAFGFGVPLAFGTRFGIYTTVMLSLGLVSGAYIAETLRAGIQAVPKGQMEAARSLGMSSGRAMVSIVIPQAFRIILPPLTNELILLTKDSSLIYLLGLSLNEYELTKFGRDAMNQTANLTPLVVTGLCYLIITIPLGFAVRRLESRSAKAR
ncbi:amino acid ABC transporter permease [Pengzhenrongella sicca]|uniref:Amino acid ABC transporter permease n=1 Tax=Pengzhenrongella sicca TaxID=2819238 RepID=A0A8A4ZA84_9MICO|nr:amino acid ABC transporter permease [Pengzhenrongella sicca]QTE28832.1 amino acid ABC transporter permease [Pengzhenrongella sicca]